MPPVYRGHFGKPQAERLLWRAGFGPRPGEAERLAKLGLEGAVHALMRPGRDRLKGPRPHDDRGRKLSPYDRWGHDQLWWLDRMVRTTKPLHERMTLVWHDWFATSTRRRRPGEADAAPEPALPARRPQLVPGAADGGHARPGDAALALGRRQREGLAERELRARADGALHARRRPRRVHRARRARAGPRADRLPLHVEQQARPGHASASTRSATTPATKTIFGKRGHFDWRDSCRLCVHHRLHPSFFVDEALELLRPGRRPSAATRRSLERLYVQQRLRGRARSSTRSCAIPRSTPGRAWSSRRSLYLAGLLRGLGRGIDTEAWTWLDRARRPAALLPAERRRLGRHALARHGDLPRALGDRGLRDAAEAC